MIANETTPHKRPNDTEVKHALPWRTRFYIDRLLTPCLQ